MSLDAFSISGLADFNEFLNGLIPQQKKQRKSSLPDFLSCLQRAQAAEDSKVAGQSCVKQSSEPPVPSQPPRLPLTILCGEESDLEQNFLPSH